MYLNQEHPNEKNNKLPKVSDEPSGLKIAGSVHFAAVLEVMDFRYQYFVTSQ